MKVLNVINGKRMFHVVNLLLLINLLVVVGVIKGSGKYLKENLAYVEPSRDKIYIYPSGKKTEKVFYLPSGHEVVYLKWLYLKNRLYYVEHDDKLKVYDGKILSIDDMKVKRFEDEVGEKILNTVKNNFGVSYIDFLKVDFNESKEYMFFRVLNTPIKDVTSMVIVRKSDGEVILLNKRIVWYDVSPDERYVVYSTFVDNQNLHTGRREEILYLFDLKKGKSVFLTCGRHPVFCGNSSLIYLKYSESWRLSPMKYDLISGKIQPVRNPWSGVPYNIIWKEFDCWELSGCYNLYFTRRSGMLCGLVLIKFDLTTGTKEFVSMGVECFSVSR